MTPEQLVELARLRVVARCARALLEHLDWVDWAPVEHERVKRLRRALAPDGAANAPDGG
jgi:hypothetical protein